MRFVLALLILVKGTRRLVATVTAFTIAHSLTLAGATLGFVHVPGPPVEAAIALSIAFVAAEITHSRQGKAGLTERFPWVVAFTFGLLHGFGFAGALSEVGLPQTAIPVALLFFNVGVELGQLAVLAVIVPVLNATFRYVVAERMGTIILSAIVAHTAWHWMTERGAQLLQFPFPEVDAPTVLTMVRWAMGLVAVAALIWIAGVLRRSRDEKTQPDNRNDLRRRIRGPVIDEPGA